MNWDDVPPFTRFMMCATALNTAVARSVDEANRSGRFGFWSRVAALVLWAWLIMVMLPDLADMLTGKG